MVTCLTEDIVEAFVDDSFSADVDACGRLLVVGVVLCGSFRAF